MISASLVQSPVFYGHTQIVNFKALRPLAAEEARDAFAQAEDIELSQEGEFRLRLQIRPPAAIFLLAVYITITGCRSKFSSGQLSITFGLPAR